MTVGRVRPAVAAMASYRPGKSAAQAEDEHGITDAIKLASNENPYQPVPAIVAAIAAAASDVNRWEWYVKTADTEQFANVVLGSHSTDEADTTCCG